MRVLDSSSLAGKAAACAEQLARFFPNVEPASVPVQVVVLRAASENLRETVVVQFAGAEHVIFLSTLPIEFNDPVRLGQLEGGASTEGSVIAVQYEEGHKAVAVRFTDGPCHWLARR